MKTTNKSGIKQLREWFRAMVKFQFNPLWISDPIAHRASRPAILGDESERERKVNDLLCAKFTAKSSAKK